MCITYKATALLKLAIIRIKILENGDFTFLDDMCKEEYGTLTKIEAERYF